MPTDQTENASHQEVGGFVRGILRSIIRTLGSSGLGSFPTPHPRTIVKSSEKLSDLLEIRDQIKNARDYNQVAHPSKFKAFANVVIRAIPGFVKNSLSGTIVFSVYDELVSAPHEYSDDWRAIALFGSLGGLSHGIFYTSWDIIASKLAGASWRTPLQWPNLRASLQLPYSVPGTIAAHTLVHSTLFTTYVVLLDVFKSLLGSSTVVVAKNEEEERLLDVARRTVAVGLSGASSGIICEALSHYLAPVEEEGWVGLSMVRSVPRPSLRVLAPAVLPSGLGFLAYEFGKDL